MSQIPVDYAAYWARSVATAPFRHVVVPGFVPAAELGAVVADLPNMRSGGSHPIGGLRMGRAAEALFEELEGPRFRNAVARRFGLDLDGAPTMITLRGQSREKDGRIHTDSAAKRVTVLLYLTPDKPDFANRDGCLRLLRSASDLEDYAVEVPPTNGTLLVFPNGPTTWHGHRTYVGQRYVVQLNYMTSDDKARSELRRHRMSAMLKRLNPFN